MKNFTEKEQRLKETNIDQSFFKKFSYEDD